MELCDVRAIAASQAETAPVIRKIEFFRASGPFESDSARCRSQEPSLQKDKSIPTITLCRYFWIQVVLFLVRLIC